MNDNADDELEFVNETDDAGAPRPAPWRLLIVDDEPEVHEVTKLALRNFEYGTRPLEFVSAFSADDARKLLRKDPDFALALVDVIMEDDGAGLELVRFIRDQLKNRRLRIVLRTGQPGMHDETDVMKTFEINDYKAKTELTRAKLVATVTAALRTVEYIDEVFELQERLKSSQRWSMLGELAIGVFHEIATPITLLIDANSIIKRMLTETSPPDLLKASARIDRASQRVMSLMHNMQEMAWSGVERAERVPLKTVFANALELCTVRTRSHGVEVKVELQDEAMTVNCLQRQLEQVLINLINNASDALADRDVRRITLSAVATEGGGAVIDVVDSGPGIPEELRERIFQSFFTTKPRGKGTGLGLSICVGILEGIGGRLELAPAAPGEGARFRLVMPAVAKSPVARA